MLCAWWLLCCQTILKYKPGHHIDDGKVWGFGMSNITVVYFQTDNWEKQQADDETPEGISLSKNFGTSWLSGYKLSDTIINFKQIPFNIIIKLLSSLFVSLCIIMMMSMRMWKIRGDQTNQTFHILVKLMPSIINHLERELAVPVKMEQSIIGEISRLSIRVPSICSSSSSWGGAHQLWSIFKRIS